MCIKSFSLQMLQLANFKFYPWRARSKKIKDYKNDCSSENSYYGLLEPIPTTIVQRRGTPWTGGQSAKKQRQEPLHHCAALYLHPSPYLTHFLQSCVNEQHKPVEIVSAAAHSGFNS